MIALTAKRSSAVHPAIKEPLAPDLLHQKAFDNSLQPNMIINVPGGQIIRVNKAACRLLAYSKKELLTMNRTDIFCTSDLSYKRMIRKRKEEGQAKAEVFMVKKGGKKFPCEVTSVIFKDQTGLAHSIVSIVDLSERQHRQEKINVENKRVVADNIVIAQSKADSIQSGSDNWMKSVSQTTYDVIWDWDMVADEIYFGNNYSKVFGYKLNKNRITFKEWMDLFKPKERAPIKKKFKAALSSGKQAWEINYQFTCPDHSVCDVTCRARTLRDTQGKAIRVIGVMHDSSKMTQLEKSLELQIKTKETEMTEAVADAKEMERSDLGKELHDNINQLLGAAVLYLDLARTDIKDVDIYVIHSQEYIRIAIEEIRKLSKGLTTDILNDFGLTGAIHKMSRDTMQSTHLRVHCALDESFEHTLSAKFKNNAFRILQEQLNNIIRHANASNVHIRLSKTANGCIVLSISDDGKGFDTGVASKGIGISNIISRAKSIHGDAHFTSQHQKGCKLTVRFPKAGQMMDN